MSVGDGCLSRSVSDSKWNQSDRTHWNRPRPLYRPENRGSSFSCSALSLSEPWILSRSSGMVASVSVIPKASAISTRSAFLFDNNEPENCLTRRQ